MADTGDGGCRGGYVETGQMCRRRSPGQSLVLGLNSQAPLPRRGSVRPPGHLKQATCLPSQPYFSPKTHTRSLSLCKEFDTVYKYPEGRSRRASPGFPGKSQGVQAEDASRGCRSCSGPRNEVLSSGQGWLQGGLQRYRPGAESPGLTATPGISPSSAPWLAVSLGTSSLTPLSLYLKNWHRSSHGGSVVNESD